MELDVGLVVAELGDLPDFVADRRKRDVLADGSRDKLLGLLLLVVVHDEPPKAINDRKNGRLTRFTKKAV